MDRRRGVGSAASGASVTLRLGYFPNLTHAVAIAGIQKGIYAKDLGSGVTLKTSTFNAGPEAVQALFSGAIDASFVGPNPTINAWAKSKGKAIKVISGAASGGAYLVVKPGITSAADLKGKKIATPQLGNTQDVALRYWLEAAGAEDRPVRRRRREHRPAGQRADPAVVRVRPDRRRLGARSRTPPASSSSPAARSSSTRRTCGRGGKYVTTDLVVTQKFLDAHPDVVKALLQGEVDTLKYLNDNPTEAQATVNDGIQAISGKALKPDVLAAAWKNVTFTVDPIASSLVAGCAARRGRGPARQGRPRRALRPRPAQRGPHRGRAVRRSRESHDADREPTGGCTHARRTSSGRSARRA